MYPLGFLFGLGFDTATEIGVLGISAAEASKGLSVWSILVFPAPFTAGMSLVDSCDSVLVVGAYGWAFTNPVRKLYYNLAITGFCGRRRARRRERGVGPVGDNSVWKAACWSLPMPPGLVSQRSGISW